MRIGLDDNHAVRVAIGGDEILWFRLMISEGLYRCSDLGDKECLVQTGVFPRSVEALVQVLESSDAAEGELDALAAWGLAFGPNKDRPGRGNVVVFPFGKASSLVEAPPYLRVRRPEMLSVSREESVQWIGWLSDALWSGEIDFPYFIGLMRKLVIEVREQEADSCAPVAASLWCELVDMQESHLPGYGPVSVSRRGDIEDVLTQVASVIADANVTEQ